MANRFLALVCAGLFVVGGLSSARAAGTQVYDGVSIDDVAAILTAAGASVEKVDTNIIRITNGPLVALTGCKAASKCFEVGIFRTFSDVHPTLDAVNKWNYDTEVPEASVDENGYLHLEFWVSGAGLTGELLTDSIGWFESAWQDQESVAFWKPYIASGTGM